MKHKVILYMGCDIPDGNAAAIRVYSNSQALRLYGHKVYILSFDHNYCNAADIYKTEMFDFVIYHVKYPNSRIEFLRYLVDISVYEKVESLIKSDYGDTIDSVITYDQPGISFYRLYRKCIQRKIPLICDCAEWHSAAHLSGLNKIVKQLDVCFCMRFAYKKSAGLIAISQYLESYYNGHTKVLRVPPLHCVSGTDRHCVSSGDSRTVRFVYAGSPGKDKDCLNEVLEAFSDIDRDFSLCFLGLTEEECITEWPELKRSIERIRSHANVSFLGWVSHDQAVGEVAKSDFSIIIRKKTRKNNAGFPSKFSESICYGTPVVCTDFSDVRYYIDNYHLGYVKNEEETLRDFFLKVFTVSDKVLNELKNNCRKFDGFKYTAFVDELGEFIAEIN